MKKIPLSGRAEKILSVVFLAVFVLLLALLFSMFLGQRKWIILLLIIGAIGLFVLIVYMITVFRSAVEVPKVEHAYERPWSLQVSGLPKYEVNIRGAQSVTTRTLTGSGKGAREIVFLDEHGAQTGAILTDFYFKRSARTEKAAREIADRLGMIYEISLSDQDERKA